MCDLNNEQMATVRLAVGSFMKKGRPFTGWDVWQYCIGRNQLHLTESKFVSSYVRELFNRGDMPEWASTQVIPKLGPVLYFHVPPRSLAGIKSAEIRATIPNR